MKTSMSVSIKWCICSCCLTGCPSAESKVPSAYPIILISTPPSLSLDKSQTQPQHLFSYPSST